MIRHARAPGDVSQAEWLALQARLHFRRVLRRVVTDSMSQGIVIRVAVDL